MMNIALVLFLAGTKVLTLSEALQLAQRDQPTVHQAHANTEAAKARVGEARAPLLPQLSGTASYTRGTNNTYAVSSPCTQAVFNGSSTGGAAGMAVLPPPSWSSCDKLNLSVTAIADPVGRVGAARALAAERGLRRERRRRPSAPRASASRSTCAPSTSRRAPTRR